ncbi:hypothetical protein [Rhodococcus erythropolis]|nr:hypothetical protein [Rhodococcus erythropolis]
MRICRNGETVLVDPFYTSVTRLLFDADRYRERPSINEVDHPRL